MKNRADRCACGKPLHYESTLALALVEAFIKRMGETVPVATQEGKWLVPRHYLALHGVKAVELPEIAGRFGFKKVA